MYIGCIVFTGIFSIYLGIVWGYKILCNEYSYEKAGSYAWRIPFILLVFPFYLVESKEIKKPKAIKKYLTMPHKCLFFAFLYENDFELKRKRSKEYPTHVLFHAHLIDRRF